MSIFRGRPWPEPGEPLFTDDDREHAIAAVLNKRDNCPGCGEPVEVSTARESEFEYAAEAVRCHACAAQAHAGSEIDDKSGLLVSFTRRPVPRE